MRIKVPSAAKAPDGGNDYTKPTRFSRPSDIMGDYERSVQRRGNRNSWVNIVRAYERHPYKDKDGTLMPNFGQLHSKVNKQVSGFVDFAIERDPWARVKTDYGMQESQNKQWGEHITFAFHRWCVKKWEDSFLDIMLAIKDAHLFSKGTFVYLDNNDLYPDNVPVEHVWPDSEAGMTPKTFDRLYVEKRYTAKQLFDKVRYTEVAKRDGWNRSTVLAILRSTSDSFKEDSHDTLFQKFSTNQVTQPELDFLIDVIHGFVIEYKGAGEDIEGNVIDIALYEEKKDLIISEYAFTKRHHIPKPRSGKEPTDADIDKTGYLKYAPHQRKCMTEVVNLVAITVCRNYYEDPSYAQLCYTMSKTYDLVMNRVLQGIQDNMRIYLRSQSAEAMNKLMQMRHGNTQVMLPGMTLEADRMQRPVMESMQVMNGLMNDHEQQLGQYQVGSSARGGQPKTARQVDADVAEGVKLDGASMKVFNAFFTTLMKELYRRFVNLDSDHKCYKNFKRFKEYLEDKGVPKQAWDPENATVESIVNPAAGSPAAKLQQSQVIREALSRAPASPGERLAQRDAIASVAGIENVDAYLPMDDAAVSVPEDSLIGLENEALSSAFMNPKNAPVLGNQLHMRHIANHIMDAEMSLGVAERIFQMLQELPKEDHGAYLKSVTDTLIGVDNKLAHTTAHVQLAARDEQQNKKADLAVFVQKMGEIQKRQDKVEKVIGEVQQARLQESREKNGTDPELSHKEAMYAIEYEYKVKNLELDYMKAQMQVDSHMQNSARMTEHKNMLATSQAVTKSRIEVIKSQATLAREAVEARRKKVQGDSESSVNGRAPAKKAAAPARK
jgi:hypothetical protein